jgi:hypothetical protein
MNYDQFTQISKKRLSSPVRKLSTDSDEQHEKNPNSAKLSSSKPIEPHDSSKKGRKKSRLVQIFDSPEPKKIPQRCFKKQNLSKGSESIQIIKEAQSNSTKIIRNGFGVQIFRDGSKFKGHFKKNLAHGRGELLYTNGTKVIGKWRKNKLINASIIYESGATFKGDFQDLENGRGIVSGESFKRGRFYFTDGRYFEGLWNKRGALRSGYVYEDQFECFRLRTDDLPFVGMSRTQANMGIIINKRWIYEGQVRGGRMAGKGWIYEPFNCSYIRTDWDLNSLGRDFEFRYINQDVFYKKEFESSGGKIRKVRVFLPTGIIFEKDFDQKSENFGILRLMFEDLGGIFQGKVDSCENIRAFDGAYMFNDLRIPLKIFFDQEKELIFLVNGNFMDMKAFKIHIKELTTKQDKPEEEEIPLLESFKVIVNPETKPLKVEGNQSPEKENTTEENQKEENSESFIESVKSQTNEKESQTKEKEVEEVISINEDDLQKSVQKVMSHIDPQIIEKISENLDQMNSDFNELEDFSESFTSEKASVISDTGNVPKKSTQEMDNQLPEKEETEKLPGKEIVQEFESEGNLTQNANSSLNISVISEIEVPPSMNEELKLQIQGLDLISSQFEFTDDKNNSFKEKKEIKDTRNEINEESVEIIGETKSKINLNEVSSSFTSFNSKASENQSLSNFQNMPTPQKEKTEMDQMSFDTPLFDMEDQVDEIQKEEKKSDVIDQKEKKEEVKPQFEDSFELFED